jgi:ectoine hydroxylase-related dioxygenase (phytanoyl-CoA dioxygenase family)
MAAISNRTAGPLSLEQLAEFRDRGFVTLPALYTEDELVVLRREADRLLNLAINSSLATGERNPRMDAWERDGRVDFRKLQPVNDLSAPLRAASEDERLIAPMRQIMGDEPVLMEEKLNYKEVVDCPELVSRFNLHKGATRFPLHHDWGYYRMQGYPRDILSSAICLDACTPENGPLRVIPGTHTHDWPMKNPDPGSGNGEVRDGLFAEEDRVDVLAPAGSVLLFHSMLLHDSKSNTTDRPRRLMIYSHYPGSIAMEEDIRNRGGREAGQRVEEAYRQMVAAGEYTDTFHAPPYL